MSLHLFMPNGCRIQLSKYSSCHKRRLGFILTFHKAELIEKLIKFFHGKKGKKTPDLISISKSATSTYDLLDHLFELS